MAHGAIHLLLEKEVDFARFLLFIAVHYGNQYTIPESTVRQSCRYTGNPCREAYAASRVVVAFPV
jgi:hypothetical protein